jgi:hypothetical protein
MSYFERITPVDANGNPFDSIVDIGGDHHMGVACVQDINPDSNNTSTVNLNSGATFTGTGTTIPGVGVINVMLASDQNCTVYVDQTGDGTHYDVSDTYYYVVGVAFGVPVQVAGKSYRVRVTNTGISATTFFRLETALVPIASPMPRTLDPYQNLKVSIQGLVDQYGFNGQFDPSRQLISAEPFHLVGVSFQGTSNDTNFWTVTNSGTGSGADVGTTTAATATLVSGTANNGYGTLVSVRVGRFIPGSPNRVKIYSAITATTVANTTRVWGAFTSSAAATPQDGFYFAVNGSGVLSVNSVKAGSVTSVANGSFNGIVSTVVLDTNLHVWELIYTTNAVRFLRDGILIHTMAASTSLLTNTLHFPISAYSLNSASGTSSATLLVWNGSIYRFGNNVVSPRSQYFSATNGAGTLLKIGPGVAHRLLIANSASASDVILYDGLTNSGTVLWDTGGIGSTTSPFFIDLGDLPFYVGLVIVISGYAANVTVVYE